MSDLICPKCERSGLRWLDPDMDDLIFKGIMECKNKGCKAQYTMEQFRQAWLDKHPPDPKDQTIAALRAKLAERERECERLLHQAGDMEKLATETMLDRDILAIRLDEIYDKLGLKGDDRCPDGIHGQHILNTNALRLQKEENALYRRAVEPVINLLNDGFDPGSMLVREKLRDLVRILDSGRTLRK